MFKNDQELKESISLMLLKDPELIQTLKSKFITDDMWVSVMEHDGSLFRFAKDPSFDLCMKAVIIEGANIQYIPKRFLCSEMCEAAVRSNPGAIALIPKKYKSKNIEQLSYDGDPTLMINKSNIDQDYLWKRIEENPSLIQYIRNPSDKLKCLAIRLNPNTALYFSYLSKTMRDVIDKEWPEYRESLPNYDQPFIEAARQNSKIDIIEEMDDGEEL